MSKIAFEMRSRMDDMSDAEFEGLMNLSKSAFLNYLDDAAHREARSTARTGEPAPEFAAHTLNPNGSVSTELLALRDLRGKPCSLIFGSYTCPVFRNQSSEIQGHMARFRPAFHFIVVYVRETHPTDGWNTHSNKADGVLYAQPQTLPERALVAKDWHDAYKFNCPVVLDWADNRINDDYAGSPERLYVVDSEGTIAFKSERGPFHDSHLQDWVAAMAMLASGK